MTEEELVEVPEEEEEDEEDWDAEEESAGEPSLGQIRVHFHTGPPELVELRYNDTVTTIRQRLREEHGRNADGLAALLNGQAVSSDNEQYTVVQPGSYIVFSGAVKGG
jgi:hypothetical protein